MRTLVEFHGYWIGIAVTASWLIICLWGLGLRLLRAGDTPVFWRAVSVAQVLLVIQLLAGAGLLAAWLLGATWVGPPADGTWFQGIFHVLYGAVFPLVVLVVGHRLAWQGRLNPHTTFALVGLVNFGLVARALQTGMLG